MVAASVRGWLLVLVVGHALLPAGAAARQAPSPARSSTYTLADEAVLGREAAAAIRRHLAMVADGSADVYVRALGRRLRAAVPAEFVHPGFDYTVWVLNDDDLTTVALPGGPVFISRGMVDVAPSEAALAGLIAHEFSHVALRHGTTQVSEGERYQLGAITGRLIGETFSAHATGTLDRGVQYGATAYFLTHRAEHERQAHFVSERIMRRGGYNSQALTTMLQAISLEVLRGGPGWIRSHPTSIDGGEGGSLQGLGSASTTLQEAAVDPLSPALAVVQARLRAWPSGRNIGEAPHGRQAPLARIGRGILAPSGVSQPAAAGDLLRVSVPLNWRRLPMGNTVVFSPDGAYLSSPDVPFAATHGLQIGVARSLTSDPRGDLQTLLTAFGRGNGYFTWTPAFQQVTLGGRPGVTTTASNVSPVTGQFEYVSVSAVHLRDGSLLYVVGVAPQDEAGVYRNAFTRVLESVEILE